MLTLFHPGITLTVLVMLFGAYALADGSFMVIAAALTWPAITGLALLVIMAAWAFLIGILEVVAAARLRTAITDEWVLVVSGLLAIIFGAVLVLQPDTIALVMALMLGVHLRHTFHPVAP